MVRSRTLWFAALLVLLLLAAGCGNTPAGSNNTGDKEPATEQAAGGSEGDQAGEDTQQDDKSSSNDAGGQAAAGDSGKGSSAEAQTQTITHAMGDTEVPLHPERVVVLDNGALDSVLALGVTPVGAPSIIAVEDGFASYLQGTESITNIGTVEQPSLETIASLTPDVILGLKDTHEAIYEQLSQIAPTVFTEVGGGQWEANLGVYGTVTGKEAEAAQLLEDLDAKIAELHSTLGDALETTEVSLLRPRKDRVSVYLKPGFTGGVAEKVGIKRPALQDRDDDFNFNVTEEQIADLDGDVIILFGRETEQDYFEQKIKTSPLWQTLEAVQNDRVYPADWEVWLSGHGIQAVNLMIDDYAKFLAQ
ncbi:iron-siderophore ABC transporter substrate-binding protein [Paenibacillus sp. IB182496]|uniref:Iron-siderophore ABC transporter substrate-binding protein n=1 Tax=Paenibacillus sabuli TaxID=2772509 RepID=A0A927BZJ5_9BACL|nr:iron-siderophore ABC transporter substrate-binding protein [Paenibacillus sabuli]MBD2848470.1 iron-siderophore ABC transporter substrate-binding protein [Paenibacillus sabuli]